ncbi:MAG: acetamidase/formamidase family protein [bacterium]
MKTICLIISLVVSLVMFCSGAAMSQSGKIHNLVASPQTVHSGYFDSTIPPVLTVDSEDTVILNTMMMMMGGLRCGITYDEFVPLRQGYIDRKASPIALTGPIFVNGAEPGDVLEVRIKKLIPMHCAVNYHMPGRMGIGGLPEDFPNGQLRTFNLDLGKMETKFAPGIVVPLNPFLGTMGVAPKPGEKRQNSIPEYFGGNMDNKELVAGTTLYLPVQVKGGLFSTGDAHAGQGDGEVNVTALETAMEVVELQFVVRKDMKLERPMAETPTHWIAMGFDKDLNEAVKIALRDAIQFLVKTKGLTPDDAYDLASLVVDLRVTQIVDRNKGIHAMIPKAIFKK